MLHHHKSYFTEKLILDHVNPKSICHIKIVPGTTGMIEKLEQNNYLEQT